MVLKNSLKNSLYFFKDDSIYDWTWSLSCNVATRESTSTIGRSPDASRCRNNFTICAHAGVWPVAGRLGAVESIRVVRRDRCLSPSYGETTKWATCEGDLKKFAGARLFVYVVVDFFYLLPLRPSRLPIDRIAGPMRNLWTYLDIEEEKGEKERAKCFKDHNFVFGKKRNK